MKFNSFSWLCVIALLSSGVKAESLMDVYELAKQNDPKYLGGINEHAASIEGYKQARADMLPSLNLKYGLYNVEAETEGDNTISQPDSQKSYSENQMSLSLTQSIYSYSRWAAFNRSKEEVKAADAGLIRVEQDLILRVAEAYFRALTSYDEYTASLRERVSVKAHYKLIKLKRAGGLVGQADLLDSHARLLEAEANNIGLGNRVKDTLQLLSEVSGQLPSSLMPLGEAVEMSPPDPNDPQKWVQTAVEYSPELKIKEHLVEAAREEMNRGMGGHFPNIDLEYVSSSNDHKGKLLGDSYNETENRLGISISIPLFSSGGVTSKVREATALYGKTMNERDLELRAIRRNTLSTFDGVLTEIARVDALRRSVESYKKALQIKRVGFKSGVSSSLTLLDADRDLFLAQSRYIRSRYEYILNTIRLKRSVGVLSEADLLQVNHKLSGEVPLDF